MLFFFTFDYIYVYLMKIVIFYEKYHIAFTMNLIISINKILDTDDQS